mmetsp:Transcript_985/g.2955  ORF Transcript_985/g.2955 Transcript_985/m.2955 type:complete len:405 (-) Transcript_985:988-2202(-)
MLAIQRIVVFAPVRQQGRVRSGARRRGHLRRPLDVGALLQHAEQIALNLVAHGVQRQQPQRLLNLHANLVNAQKQKSNHHGNRNRRQTTRLIQPKRQRTQPDDHEPTRVTAIRQRNWLRENPLARADCVLKIRQVFVQTDPMTLVQRRRRPQFRENAHRKRRPVPGVHHRLRLLVRQHLLQLLPQIRILHHFALQRPHIRHRPPTHRPRQRVQLLHAHRLVLLYVRDALPHRVPRPVPQTRPHPRHLHEPVVRRIRPKHQQQGQRERGQVKRRRRHQQRRREIVHRHDVALVRAHRRCNRTHRQQRLRQLLEHGRRKEGENVPVVPGSRPVFLPAFEREIIELPGRPVRLHIRSARARCDDDLPFQVASLLSHASHGPSPSPESSTRRWTLLPALTPQQSHCHT